MLAKQVYGSNHNVNSHHIKKILIVVAMESEGLPIISALHLQKSKRQFSPLPMQAYVGNIHGIDLMLIENGIDPVNHVQNIGTQAATLTTYVGYERFHPDLIISIGSAGGVLQNESRINGIYYSTAIFFYDRRLPIPGYHEYGLGDYKPLNLSDISKKIGIQPGVICSDDSFDDNKTDYDTFIKLHCSAIEMEAAGVAWVSMLTNTPILAIKGITNYVKGENVHTDYQHNLPHVTKALSVKLKKLLIQLAESNEKH